MKSLLGSKPAAQSQAAVYPPQPCPSTAPSLARQVGTVVCRVHWLVTQLMAGFSLTMVCIAPSSITKTTSVLTCLRTKPLRQEPLGYRPHSNYSTSQLCFLFPWPTASPQRGAATIGNTIKIKPAVLPNKKKKSTLGALLVIYIHTVSNSVSFFFFLFKVRNYWGRMNTTQMFSQKAVMRTHYLPKQNIRDILEKAHFPESFCW